MPRTKEQNSSLRIQRMEEILQAALNVYVDKGYSAAEVSDVANRAGVAKGLVHYYFKDKATLFRELFATMMKKANENLQSQFSQPGPILQLFENHVTSMYENASKNREIVLFFMRMSHDLKMVFSEEEIKELKWPYSQMDIYEQTLSKGMETGEIRRMSPALLAVQFSGSMFHGLNYVLRAIDNKKPRDVLAKDIEDAVAVCRAVLSPES